MRTTLSLALALLAVGSAACSSAPQPTGGEDPLFDAGPPESPDAADDATTTTTASPSCAPDGGATWTDLYRDCFSIEYAGCGQSTCHSSALDPGAMASGFVCGATQDACWTGMTAMGSIVPAGGSSSPTTTHLYQILRKAPPLVGGSMPKMSTFAFTQADLDRITTWIENGAPND